MGNIYVFRSKEIFEVKDISLEREIFFDFNYFFLQKFGFSFELFNSVLAVCAHKIHR